MQIVISYRGLEDELVPIVKITPRDQSYDIQVMAEGFGHYLLFNRVERRPTVIAKFRDVELWVETYQSLTDKQKDEQSLKAYLLERTSELTAELKFSFRESSSC